MGPLHGSDQFIQFQLPYGAVSVLRMLNQEHHQEGDNDRAGVDDQLSGIAQPEEGSGHGPARDDQNGQEERQGMPHGPSGARGKSSKD
jgi:hypothetical protein